MDSSSCNLVCLCFFFFFFYPIYVVQWRLGTRLVFQPSFCAMLHHITFVSPSKPFCVMSLCSLVCFYPHSPPVFTFLSIVFCCRRVTPTHCCIFTPAPSPFTPFSMYIVVVVHSRSLLPTRTFSPTCFISPFFTAVHEMGCMYDESVELEMGKN